MGDFPTGFRPEQADLDVSSQEEPKDFFRRSELIQALAKTPGMSIFLRPLEDLDPVSLGALENATFNGGSAVSSWMGLERLAEVVTPEGQAPYTTTAGDIFTRIKKAESYDEKKKIAEEFAKWLSEVETVIDNL